MEMSEDPILWPVTRCYNSISELFAPDTALQTALKAINNEIDFIFDREEEFLERFSKGNTIDLTEVSFTSISVKIVYILDCGQHVTDSIPMDDYLAWRGK